jgi:hypothetical protein
MARNSDGSEVRLRLYSLGERGGRTLEATRIVRREYAEKERAKWERDINKPDPRWPDDKRKFVVTIQTTSASGGPIVPRV